MSSQIKLSVAIISRNEEARIASTLDAIKDIADEIILVDSGSTDSTIEIAERYSAKVYSEGWKGFAMQKNSCIEKCSGEYILFLDSDEVATKELCESISKVINSAEIGAWSVDRVTNYCGENLYHAWRPDIKFRLVSKSLNPIWVGEEVHEELKCDSKNIRLLKGDLIHYSYRDISHHFQKTIEYSKLSAISYKKRNKKFSILNLFLNPAIAFIKLYILNKGVLDGVRGLIAAFSSATGVFLKYAYLWDLERKDK
jgi:glycosyltransferase involved in cell wall biosynthesis